MQKPLANCRLFYLLSQSTISEILDFVKEKSIEDRPGWYIHDLRKIAMTLLANYDCGDLAQDVASLYDKINIITHST